jgi:hypothetical protein
MNWLTVIGISVLQMTMDMFCMPLFHLSWLITWFVTREARRVQLINLPKPLSLHPILVVIVLLKVLFSTQICCDHCLNIHPFFVDIVVSSFHWLTPSDYLVFWGHLQTLFKISTL